MNGKWLKGIFVFAGLSVTLTLVIAGVFAQSTTPPAPAPARPAAHGQQGPAPNLAGKTAEQAYKNIQVLKGAPADQLIPAMQFITASLGVECEFCHVQNEFDKDDKKNKATARKMIQMQMAINQDHFEGHREVTCTTCHRGSNDPVAIPIISDEEPKPAREEATSAPASAGSPALAPGGAVTPPQRPSADPILDKYVQALGGAEAIQKISSRVEKGTMIFARGQVPVEVFAKAPDKRITVVRQPNGDNMTAYDGRAGWLGAAGRPARDMSDQENDAVRLDADFHFATDLKQIFSQFRVGRPEKIGDRQTTVVSAIRQGLPPVRLYFDDQTGLLLRLVRYAETPLGRNPTQVDYADYRDTGGVKIPYRWTIARPNGRFTIQVDQVQQNVSIDDSKFSKPAAPAAPEAAK
jgi:photosynthetic reaction center cytochrome c subunit